MNTLLIRAEDKNEWERRCPIVPEDLNKLIKAHVIKVYIQSSLKRIFPEKDFIKAGADPCDTMEPGDIIFGVKEIPVPKILENKTYLFFSHTIKGQMKSMPMLKRIIDSGSTLIDYEKITDDNGRRKVFFGQYAGEAGAINILWLMGEYWQKMGLRTPFLNCRQALNYHAVSEAVEELKAIGSEIKKYGLPEEISPLVIGILGYGHVSGGAQDILSALPVEYITPDELSGLDRSSKSQKNKVYITVFHEEHIVKRKDGGLFRLDDYYKHPEFFRSDFDKYLPYLSILINAIYWDKRYPRFVTWENLAKLFSSGSLPKLQGIADITCDVNGSVECNVKTTKSDNPAYTVNPMDRTVRDGNYGEDIILLAVDNLPAELPKDSSIFFSKQLFPYIPGIVRADFSKSLDKSCLPEDIKRAVIVYKGELTPPFQYLKEYL
ncbi:MAG: hypothetical protein JXR46_10670 [Calditrichaceae bacterium]|nr:hypothetical protein [Calditrichaceae bacterium]MBN2709499.1 hypothetical protein [Calditrichaceae bacterium]RQV95954.1 MAG: hypothetical protein EH224_06215 [Calditrichota bacterium]